MPMMSGSEAVPVQLERDHSPLPDVEAGLFDDFFRLGVLRLGWALRRRLVLQRERC
jgi:hypothetical protein